MVTACDDMPMAAAMASLDDPLRSRPMAICLSSGVSVFGRRGVRIPEAASQDIAVATVTPVDRAAAVVDMPSRTSEYSC